MDILTIDFESFYSQSYSLSKMTTEEYIRGAEFEVIGVGVKLNNNVTQAFTGTMSETADWLAQFDWKNSLALAHNAMFDAFILSEHFGIRPKGWLDTLSMARALHGTQVGGSLKVLAEYYGVGEKGEEVVHALGLRRTDFSPEQMHKYMLYCMNDVDLTWDIFNLMSPSFPQAELRLIDLTIRMFSDPVLRLDLELLTNHLHDVHARKIALLEQIDVDQEALSSNTKFVELLEAMGVEIPMKVSPKTGKLAYAFAKTDEAFVALLEHEDERVQALVAARLGVKSTLEQTRTERFIGIAKRGPLPVPLRYYGAHTGRWGGDDKLNLQNLPRGGALKKSILAPEGYVMIDCDSSQIEARTVAWLAEQDDLVGAFERGEDVYCLMASAIYGRTITKADKTERQVGKVVILGAGYGIGAEKLRTYLKVQAKVEVDHAESQHIVDTYRAKYAYIPRLWDAAQKVIPAMAYDQYVEFGRGGVLKVEGKKGIRLPNGLYMHYPNLRKMQNEDGYSEWVYDRKKGRATIPTKLYGGRIIENVCQALARIAIGSQMLLLAKKYRVVLTVHDSIVCIAPVDEQAEAVEFVEACMRTRPSWGLDLPLNCESKCGVSYG